MKRIGTLAFAALAIGLLLAGNAQAGYVLATYDLAGSTVTTNTPLGSDVDQITGQVTFRYWTPTASAPLTGANASLVGGDTFTVIDQSFPAGLFLNGYNDQTVGGQNIAMLPGGNAQMLGPAAATQHNELHCTGGLCGIAGFTASVTQINDTNNPFFIPAMLFTSLQAGVGDWTAATLTQDVGGGANVQIKYQGQEISRAFIPEPGTASLVYLGIAGMAGASSYMRRRRNR